MAQRSCMLVSGLALAACGPTAAQPGETVCWSDQFGTDGRELPFSLAVDHEQNVFVAGTTSGRFDTGDATAYGDGFVARYGLDGTRHWIRQLGGPYQDVASSVAVTEGGRAIVAGWLRQHDDPEPDSLGAIGMELDASGDVVRRFVLDVDVTATDVAVAADGSVFFCGLGRPEVDFNGLVARFDAEGRQLWVETLDTSEDDWPHAIAVDESGHAYVAGATRGALGSASAGGADAFVAKFEPDGARPWTKQFGTAEDEYASDVTALDTGTVFVIGGTGSATNLDGEPTMGRQDAFATRLSGDGTLQEIVHFGTEAKDLAIGIVRAEGGDLAVLGSSGLHDPDPFVALFDAGGTVTMTPLLVDEVRPIDAAIVEDRLLVLGSVGESDAVDVEVTWLCE